MYINYEYYRVFYYAAKCGNLTKAAALLQNSQPNLTRAIKTLEAELGCTLFSRTNRGLILTPEGEALYRHIRVAFAEIDLVQLTHTDHPLKFRTVIRFHAAETLVGKNVDQLPIRILRDPLPVNALLRGKGIFLVCGIGGHPAVSRDTQFAEYLPGGR